MARAEGVSADETQTEEAVSAAFGEKNRAKLIQRYFSTEGSAPLTPDNAWAHVYKLLLWADRTTALAHCYESDKCQPGKNWYARSLAFHDWLSTSLSADPSAVATHIDWLFIHATRDLIAEVVRNASRVARVAERQLEPYVGRNFPRPGEDPELVSLVRKALEPHLISEPSDERWQLLVSSVRQHLTLENKRKNLVGEGFEDVIAEVVRRTCGEKGVQASTRKILQEIPGFSSSKKGEKPNKVDIAIVRPEMRTLVTAKWSLRADREKQFVTEFNEYVAAESDGQPFEYVFVTNEFDPARLMRACEKLAMNAYMFKHVIHINTDALRATYGGKAEKSMRKVLSYIDDGRLISLSTWLKMLSA